jgi:hypothetical protein
MDILYLIIWILVHLFTAFLCSYSNDSIKIWKDNKEIRLKEPSLYDLDLADLLKAHSYVEDIIKTSHHYFVLRNTIEAQSKNYSGYGTQFIVQVSSLLFIIKYMREIFSSLNYFTVSVISIIICVVGYLIVSMVYQKSNFSIAKFNYDEQELKNEFVYDESEYPLISEETAFNNFVINKHYHYLLSIEGTVWHRATIRKILSALATIIYVLFFMQYPD